MVKKPIIGIAGCCARATSGQAAAPPVISVMNSRRLMDHPSTRAAHPYHGRLRCASQQDKTHYFRNGSKPECLPNACMSALASCGQTAPCALFRHVPIAAVSDRTKQLLNHVVGALLEE